MKERRMGQSDYRRQAARTSEQLQFLSQRPHGVSAALNYSSNRKLWVYRPSSEDAFKSIFRVISEAFEPQTWRRAPLPLHVTMIQSRQQLLPSIFDTLRESEVCSMITNRTPSVAHPLTLAINGLRRLGSKVEPCVAIGLSDTRLEFERSDICEALNKEWVSPDFKWPRFSPHVSLARVYNQHDARRMEHLIRPLLPTEIRLEPVEVAMDELRP